ncbi:MAG TPA: glycosyltransferase [Pseudonocardiaceae bacterium]|nr:glycosyltransferase [Pseudonocardiaceae bacterium]
MIFSVITPVYDPVAEYLTAAYDSLHDQEMPPGWEWEWIAQEDGRTGVAHEILPADPRISFGTGRHAGVAITRNLGLARASGSVIKTLDQDDILTPGVLGRDIIVLRAHDDVHRAASRALDLLPDGSTVVSAILQRLLTALGGWMAVPGSDDTGMLVAASILAPGYFHGDVGLLYRKYPGQATASADHNEVAERRLRMSVIRERAESIIRWSPGF